MIEIILKNVYFIFILWLCQSNIFYGSSIRLWAQTLIDGVNIKSKSIKVGNFQISKKNVEYRQQ